MLCVVSGSQSTSGVVTSRGHMEVTSWKALALLDPLTRVQRSALGTLCPPPPPFVTNLYSVSPFQSLP